jgi:hypothetical protein
VVKALEDARVETPTFEQARAQLAAEASRESREKLLGELRSSIDVRVHPERIASRGNP